jgi:hypothetical protein
MDRASKQQPRSAHGESVDSKQSKAAVVKSSPQGDGWTDLALGSGGAPSQAGSSREEPVVFSGAASLSGDHGGTASAVTLHGNIRVAPFAEAWSPRRRALLYAHEAVHVAQQNATSGLPGDRKSLEAEARELAPAVAVGLPMRPRLRADPSVPLFENPQGPTVEELRELDRLWEATRGPGRRRITRLRHYRRILAERESTGESRARMERFPSDEATLERYVGTLLIRIMELLPRVSPAARARAEEDLELYMTPLRDRARRGLSIDRVNFREIYERLLLSTMNRRALTIDVMDVAIYLDIRFQARFEGRTDEEARASLPTLERNLRAGMEAVWGQELTQPPFVERQLFVRPNVQLLASGATRDPARILITVRPSDTAPLNFEGQPIVPLEEQQTGDSRPVSVTRTDLAGGVMSIPPRHIERPSVLGHETLHLFGLIDRYAIRDGGEIPIRATGGRDDPLGAQEGNILDEDLDFIFRELGVYALEAERLSRHSPIATSRNTEVNLRDFPLTVEEVDRELEVLEARGSILDSLPPMAPETP